MSRFTAHIGSLLLCMVCLLGLPACDVHELPEGRSDVDVSLHLTFDRDLAPYKTVIYPPETKATGPGSVVRYELRIYRGVPGNFEREAFMTRSFTMDMGDNLDLDIKLQLHAGRYLAQLWVDFTSETGKPYWDAASFQEVRINGEYIGGNSLRDAYFTQEELPLETLITAGATYETTLTLSRPLAQYRFIATDRDEFLQYWARESAIRHGSSVKQVISPSELEDFKVKVIYSQYLPNAFNIWTDSVSDAGTGYSFWTNMHLREDGNVDLGWDWALLGPAEGLVVASLEFYAPDGEYISTLRNIEVPLKRSGLTTVQGRILTSGVDSGIAIDPTFDGEFNVYL